MKSLVTIISLGLCLLLLESCVSTRVTSLVDPLYRDSSYARVLVIGNYKQIEKTKSAEKHMVQHLLDSGIFAVANSELLPPLRKYSDSEITVIYRKYNLDACIIVSAGDEESQTYYMPGWTHINNDVRVNKGFGAIPGSTTVTTSVSSTPGMYQTQVSATTQAELRDIKTGTLVSKCEANSDYYKDIWTSSDYVIGSIMKQMVAEFKRNKLLRKN